MRAIVADLLVVAFSAGGDGGRRPPEIPAANLTTAAAGWDRADRRALAAWRPPGAAPRPRDTAPSSRAETCRRAREDRRAPASSRLDSRPNRRRGGRYCA